MQDVHHERGGRLDERSRSHASPVDFDEYHPGASRHRSNLADTVHRAAAQAFLMQATISVSTLRCAPARPGAREPVAMMQAL